MSTPQTLTDISAIKDRAVAEAINTTNDNIANVINGALPLSGHDVTAGVAAVAGPDNNESGFVVMGGTAGAGIAVTPTTGVAAATYLEVDSFGTGNFSALDLFFARGVSGTPTAAQATDPLGIVYFVGYGATQGVIGAQIEAIASDNFTAAHGGTSLHIGTAPTNSITVSDRIVIDASGNTNIENGTLIPANGITAAGGFVVSPRLVATGGVPALSAASSYTAQTPVTTEFYFAEVFVPANCSVTGVAVFNSATISGNMKVGLTDSSGNILATSASTAMSGTTTYQRVAFTGAYAAVGPAIYYICVFYDNNTVRPNTFTSGDFGVGKSTSQTFSTGFTTITPPTTFTTALGPVASLY